MDMELDILTQTQIDFEPAAPGTRRSILLKSAAVALLLACALSDGFGAHAHPHLMGAQTASTQTALAGGGQ
jgi:hypothetical protein